MESPEELNTAAADGIVPTGPEAALPPRKAAATFIFFTIVLDMLALGMIAPVLPKLIEGFVGGSAVRTAGWIGWFGTVWAVAQFICSPILGSLSDRFGRRPIVLLSNLGLGLDYCVMAAAPTLPWLFAGRILSGITSSSIPTAMAYAADVTPPERRAQTFGMLSGAFGLGFILGPALGGLLGNISPRLPFWVSAGLSLLNFCYGLFVLPESLAREHRGRFSWRKANPLGSIGLLRSNATLTAFSLVLLFGYMSQQCLQNVYVVYTDYRYHWTPRTVGLSLALVGIGTALVGAVLVKIAVRALGERATILTGASVGAAGYLLIALSSNGNLVWGGILCLTGMSLVWPTAQGIMSRNVGPSEQGHLQGSIQGLRGLTGMIGPGIYTWVFVRAIGSTSTHVPGAPFFLASLFILVLFFFAVRATNVHARASA